MKKSVPNKPDYNLVDPVEAYHASRRQGHNKPSLVSVSQNTTSNAGGRITFDPATSLSDVTTGNKICSPNSSYNKHPTKKVSGST